MQPGRRRAPARQLPDRAHIARLGAGRPWELLHSEDYVAALGAPTGNMAVQHVGAGLNAVYLSGWQVAADALRNAVDAVGNTAVAIRMDSSLGHGFVVGYAANALLMYVYPLPETSRADPVGVAIVPDAVLAFHDGASFTTLPELSAPPTALGAPKPPSQTPTP